ncbi:MAG: porin family protein [Gemmatimonadaceae bacterium]|nr:porin family protein [Gemmatimonadaceae bacterium]
MIARFVRGAIAATALLVAVSSTAEAQGRFGAMAGIALPTGEFGDFADMGFSIGGNFYQPINDKLSLRVDLDWSTFSLDGVDENWTQLGVMVNGMIPINTGTGLMPYALVGIGYYQQKLDVFDESDLAWNVGAGFNFEMSSAKLFAEVVYRSIMSEGDATTSLPVRVGIRF